MQDPRAYRFGDAPIDAPIGAPIPDGPVLYWMRREHRCRDNPALAFAQALALQHQRPLAVAYCLVPGYAGAGMRQYGFLLRGLEATAEAIRALNVPFLLRTGDPGEEIPRLARECSAGAVVTDFDPMRPKTAWLDAVRAALPAPVSIFDVDGRNVVPCRLASDKKEYMARTIRPKIHRLLPDFVLEPDQTEPHPHPWPDTLPSDEPDWAAARASLHADAAVPEVDWCIPGEDAAAKALDAFLKGPLARWDAQRNFPTNDISSRLSPYLHFGQLSALRAALAVLGAHVPPQAKDAFLEQLIVRRELAENHVHHEPAYDSLDGCPDWARTTLADHTGDPREHVYTPDAFEAAATHDPLWNAAQRQMLRTGYMHGYLRMYWAKKILEWSPSPEEAFATALALNDRWQLDGRDPNGVTGVAWSIGGLHDQGWKERPVFGKIRYMSFDGCKRKFDVAAYVKKWDA